MKKTAIFAVILAMSILGFFGCNKIPSQSGTCGENLTWTYDARRQSLTISGTGDMVTAEKFQWSDFPIRSLVIEEGVTSVAGSAFYSNHKLKGELKLPSTLREIGDFAFYGCEKLTGTLVLPDSVETVGNYAFVRCEGLTGLVLSKNLKTVGDEAFQKKSLARMMELMTGGTTVLFVSHDMASIRKMCSRVIWLDGGTIRMEGSPDEVCDAYRI